MRITALKRQIKVLQINKDEDDNAEDGGDAEGGEDLEDTDSDAS